MKSFVVLFFRHQIHSNHVSFIFHSLAQQVHLTRVGFQAGVDIICAQGTEGGGHTGEIGTAVLIPQVVDLCKSARSPLTGRPVPVVCAGGIYDGRGLAMALSLGAAGVWVGTRFIASKESAAPARHVEGVLGAKPTDTMRTLIYSGRPLRTLKTNYVLDWEMNRKQEIEELCNTGIVPVSHDTDVAEKEGRQIDFAAVYPLLMGQAASAIKSVQSAREIVESMVNEAASITRKNASMLVSKL
eukprot:m.208052 g.208052  ORF g.208052 m.208052 type:complete len:242 (-) comp18955_c0_seq2:148-873(-)